MTVAEKPKRVSPSDDRYDTCVMIHMLSWDRKDKTEQEDSHENHQQDHPLRHSLFLSDQYGHFNQRTGISRQHPLRPCAQRDLPNALRSSVLVRGENQKKPGRESLIEFTGHLLDSR